MLTFTFWWCLFMLNFILMHPFDVVYYIYGCLWVLIKWCLSFDPCSANFGFLNSLRQRSVDRLHKAKNMGCYNHVYIWCWIQLAKIFNTTFGQKFRTSSNVSTKKYLLWLALHGFESFVSVYEQSNLFDSWISQFNIFEEVANIVYWHLRTFFLSH